MINIRNKILSIPFVIFAYACMSPEGDELWIVSIDATLVTGGFARDVSVSRNKAYVAAGQSGIQIWDLENKLWRVPLMNTGCLQVAPLTLKICH